LLVRAVVACVIASVDDLAVFGVPVPANLATLMLLTSMLHGARSLPLAYLQWPIRKNFQQRKNRCNQE
jgi:phosphoribosylcarboxyaminoimidazole (NCAIR) mutase